MKIKYSYYEKVAGLFVLSALALLVASIVGIAIKRGWFDPKNQYFVEVENAEGLRPGTPVQMEGLIIGAVEKVELLGAKKIRLELEINRDFADKIRADSVIRIVRPFIIGEKTVDVAIGSIDSPVVASGQIIPSEQSFDVLDLLNGRRLAPVVNSLSQIMENLKYVADAFLDKQRTKDLVEIYDQLKPLMGNMNQMAVEVHGLTKSLNKDHKLTRVLSGLNDATQQLNILLPTVVQEAPELTKGVVLLTQKLNGLVEELQVFVPLIREMGPELPKVGRRAAEALDETVVTLKALQKTFILRGSAEEVRAAERSAQPQGERLPANK